MAELLNADVVKQIEDAFAPMKEAVHIMYFGQKENCDYCADTQKLLEEVAVISEKLSLEIYDLDKDADLAKKFNVDKAPGIVITAKDGKTISDYGVRYAGIPSGHEFTSLIQDILLVAGRDSGLMQETRDFLKELTEPVLLQVFATPTCPHCPGAVTLAHQFAMESSMVQAEMISAMEFQALSQKHNVSGVPQTTINDGAANVVGAVPESNMVTELKRITGK